MSASQYTAIPTTSCLNGVWTPSSPSAVTGVVYVPCALDLKVAGVYAATIAADGTVTISTNGITVGRGGENAPGALALVTGSAITVGASNTTLIGQAVAQGWIRVIGDRNGLRCGAVGAKISISGWNNAASVETWCASP